MVVDDIGSNEDWTSQLKLRHFVPGWKGMEPKINVLLALADPLGPGVSRTQFQDIVRVCLQCNNLCFVDKRHVHRCYGPAPHPPSDGLELMEAMLYEVENSGLRRVDVFGLLTRCGECMRICAADASRSHNCA